LEPCSFIQGSRIVKTIITNKGARNMTKKEAYEAWEQWLEKCPVWCLKLRTPTVDLETVQFDFDQYEDSKEAE
jgi:hypothetical protein